VREKLESAAVARSRATPRAQIRLAAVLQKSAPGIPKFGRRVLAPVDDRNSRTRLQLLFQTLEICDAVREVMKSIDNQTTSTGAGRFVRSTSPFTPVTFLSFSCLARSTVCFWITLG
jgi:hypothetical protein